MKLQMMGKILMFLMERRSIELRGIEILSSFILENSVSMSNFGEREGHWKEMWSRSASAKYCKIPYAGLFLAIKEAPQGPKYIQK